MNGNYRVAVTSRHDVIGCRLCGGDSERQFEHRVLGKYDVGYFQCRGCGSLQTEAPYWLSEAYGDDVHADDTNYLTRNLNVFWYIQYLIKGLKISADATVLDYGGGLGIVPRLLRENGVNAFNYDTYTKSPFADVEWKKTRPDFVFAAELFEHLPDPQADIKDIFAQSPDYVYVRTWRYFGQGSGWDYLSPSHGEHVFFYTDDAMRLIAERYGYTVELPSTVDALFCKTPLSSFQKRLVIPGMHNRAARFAARIVGKFQQ